MHSPLKTALSITAAAGLIALAGCSSTPAETLDNGDQKDVTVAVFNGWPEGEAVSYLWASILTDKGYNVELENADLSAGFVGLADGDYDVNLDVWLPVTHASQIEEFGDDIIDLGTWNTEATNNIAVNADAPIDSLDELAANADYFGNRIVGIEPGAGLTGLTQDAVMPEYGLDDFELTTSSTPAMLAELTAATEAGEGIAVTLWHPHWAYDAFPLKDLADPKGALGDAEGIHSYGRTDFDTDFPELAGWLGDFEMDAEILGTLQNVMYNSDADSSEYDAIVQQWIADNQEWVDGLTD
ncbi:MAG: glycine betaine transporter substrate-binding protein [Glaciihabitans sp.]|nr:glycine betaine transporter substrate-binding protein [Glaciihabitans sp.]